jgi:hypothetical protein
LLIFSFSLQSSSSSNPANPDSEIYLLSESGLKDLRIFRMQYAYDNVHSTPFSLQSSSSSNPVNPDSDVYLLSESGFKDWRIFRMLGG